MEELTTDQWCMVVGRSLRLTMAAIASGKLRSRKEGRRRLIPGSEVSRVANGEVKISRADFGPGKKRQEV